MKNFRAICILMIVSAMAFQARAQVVPTATKSRLSLTAGAFGSAYQPDYAGGGIASTKGSELFGAGAYVDLHVSRWVQIEAEGRWMRWNQFANIYQDNYLIGPRLPIMTIGRVTPYGKFLVGIGKMNFEYGATSCRCSDLVYGGGADVRLTRRLSWRAIDFEYQQWPSWYVNQNAQLHPYGFSSGIGFRIF
jgi:hypothetical protein